jgi:hypothetical protein
MHVHIDMYVWRQIDPQVEPELYLGSVRSNIDPLLQEIKAEHGN